MTRQYQKSFFRGIFPAFFRAISGLKAMYLNLIDKMVGTVGFEPTTPTTPLSTPEKSKPNKNKWINLHSPEIDNLLNPPSESLSIDHSDHTTDHKIYRNLITGQTLTKEKWLNILGYRENVEAFGPPESRFDEMLERGVLEDINV